MDYDSLIDAQTWAFIRETGLHYPDEAVGLDVAEQRRVYDRLCRVFHRPYPAGIGVRDVMADGVPCRAYEAGSPNVTVVFFHGGGFVVGGLDSHDDICAEICAQTGFRVVSVDYRLAPEHRHPAAFDDGWTAVKWVAATFEGAIVLVGDSAGGTLAATIAHHARGRLTRILGQVLIYPMLGGDHDKGSYLDHAHAPMLTRADVIYYNSLRKDGQVPENDPTWEPLQDDDFAGLPPTVIFTADCDPLRDDGRDYFDRLKAAGGRVHWHNEDGLVHGYLRARHSVDRARNSFERIEIAIEALGQGLWPYD